MGDGALRDDITHALHRSPFFDPGNAPVRADGGKVTLAGTMQSFHERQVTGATVWQGVCAHPPVLLAPTLSQGKIMQENNVTINSVPLPAANITG